MNVKVTFFGPLSELIEIEETDNYELVLPSGISYADALDRVVGRWPALSSFTITLAGDGVFLKHDNPIPDIRELSVFPPFAGG